MFHKLMRALGDGYRTLVQELRDEFDMNPEPEKPAAEPEDPILGLRMPHDCADDLKALG